jgi:hypothetical protein
MNDDALTAAVDNANMRMRCISSMMTFVDTGRMQNDHPMIDLVDGGNDDRHIATVTGTLLAVLIGSDQLTSYVQSAVAAHRRSYEAGRDVGRETVKLELRNLIGVTQ